MMIREYRPRDCEAIARLFYDTVHSVNARDYTPEELNAWAPGDVDLTAWNASFLAHCTMVAEEDGTVIGFGDMDQSGYLDRLYVHRDYQGRGVATAICDALERRFPAREYTTHASITAKPFFERRGYTVVKKQQVERRGVMLTNFRMRRTCRECGSMSGFCDLHAHSVYSDGTWTPEELVRGAKELGLSAIALTDHNTVAGLPEFLAAGKALGVETVAGIEFSTDYCGTELHMLGLFISPSVFVQISDLLEDGRRRKEQSNRELVEALRRDGYALDYEAIRAGTPKEQVNRAHIAAALTENGYTASIAEAFHGLLAPEQGYYRPPARPNVFEVVRFIKSVGAVAVLAHPFLNLEEGPLRDFLPQAKACGLDGMETVYPSYDAETTVKAEAIAAEFGLCPSGGSDFHGDRKAGIMLGTGSGKLRVPQLFCERLKQRRG